MGYFDGITQGAFNKDVQGRNIYYPNGKFGKGLVMETEREYQELASFHKKRVIIMIAIPLLLVTLRFPFALMLPVLAVIVISDYIITRYKTRNLVRTDIKFSMKEASERSTKAFGLPVLIGLELISIVMVIFFGLGMIGILISENPPLPAVLSCGFMFVLGLLMCWIFGRRILSLRRAR